MGYVEALLAERPFETEWVSYEIHPERAPEGIPPTERFSPADLRMVYGSFQDKAARIGLSVMIPPMMANSRLAVLAGEFAKDAGAFDAYHHAAFAAYFGRGVNIGLREELLAVAAEAGLDKAALAEALDDGRYLPRLEENRRRAVEAGVTAVPTFLSSEGGRVVGARSVDDLRRALFGDA